MQARPAQALLALVLLVLVLALPAQAPRAWELPVQGLLVLELRAWELPVQGLLVLELRAQALRQVRELLVWPQAPC